MAQALGVPVLLAEDQSSVLAATSGGCMEWTPSSAQFGYLYSCVHRPTHRHTHTHHFKIKIKSFLKTRTKFHFEYKYKNINNILNNILKDHTKRMSRSGRSFLSDP